MCEGKQKEVIEKIKKAVPNLSEFDKGYVLGKAEKMAERYKETAAGENKEDKH